MYNATLIGERIKKLRGNTSQEKCAQALGISRGALSFYENGDRKPDAEILYKMCKYFSVSADYLIGITDNPSVDADIQVACKVTGLSEKAVNSIIALQSLGTGFGENEPELFCSSKSALDLFITSDYAFSLLLGLSSMNAVSKKYVKMLINHKSKDELSKCEIGARLQFFENLEDFRRILKTIYHPLYKQATEYYSNYYSVISGYEEDTNRINQAETELQEIRKLFEKEASEHGEYNTEAE